MALFGQRKMKLKSVCICSDRSLDLYWKNLQKLVNERKKVDSLSEVVSLGKHRVNKDESLILKKTFGFLEQWKRLQ